jgi:hypothetical protein
LGAEIDRLHRTSSTVLTLNRDAIEQRGFADVWPSNNGD